MSSSLESAIEKLEIAIRELDESVGIVSDRWSIFQEYEAQKSEKLRAEETQHANYDDNHMVIHDSEIKSPTSDLGMQNITHLQKQRELLMSEIEKLKGHHQQCRNDIARDVNHALSELHKVSAGLQQNDTKQFGNSGL